MANWDVITAAAELIGAAAVVISLIYLALQVRNQVKESQMSVVNSLTQQWCEALQTFAIDEQLYRIWYRGVADFDALTEEERGRFSAILINLTQIFESLHLHHLDGKVDPGLWEGFDNRLRDVFATPGAQRWWKLRQHWHSKAFQAYVSEVISAGGQSEGRYAAIFKGRQNTSPDHE